MIPKLAPGFLSHDGDGSLVLLTVPAFCPSYSSDSHSSVSAVFFQELAAVAHKARRWHELPWNQIPHGDWFAFPFFAALRSVYWHIAVYVRVLVPYEVEEFRRIHRCDAVMRVELHIGHIQQGLAYNAVLAARERKIVPFISLEGLDPVDGCFNLL